MTKVIDITGHRFGRLVVVEQAGWHIPKKGKRVSLWRCTCDCGKSINIKKPYLTSGDTNSCGCLRQEVASALKKSHGLAHESTTYDIWVLMRQRCSNPRASGFKYYGGRGVKVCRRWDSYQAFLSDMGERPDGLTLDRIDPFGDYEPNNCRWATWEQQQKNKRKAANCTNQQVQGLT